MKRLALSLFLVCLGCSQGLPSAAEAPASGQKGGHHLPCAEEDRARIDPCRVGLEELTRVRGHHGRSVHASDGLLVRRDGQLLVLASDRPDAPFVVLDPSPAAEKWPAGLGVDRFVGHRTRIIGRYTSADVRPPAVAGAAGTLSADHIGRYAHLTPYVGESDRRYPGGKSPYVRACFQRQSIATEVCRYEIREVVQMGHGAPRGVQTIGFLRFVDGEPVLSECERWPAAAARVETKEPMAGQLAGLQNRWVEVTGVYESDSSPRRTPPYLMGWLVVDEIAPAAEPSTLSEYCHQAF